MASILKVTEEEMTRLLKHTETNPDVVLTAMYLGGGISTTPTNHWAFVLLAEWRGV